MSTSSQAKPDLSSLRIDKGQRKSRKSWQTAGNIVAAIVLVVGHLFAGAALAFRDQKPVVEVAVAQKAATGRPALLNASGYVTPRRRATVAAKITGRVTGVFFDEGMHVKQGQILATLDDSDVKTRARIRRRGPQFHASANRRSRSATEERGNRTASRRSIASGRRAEPGSARQRAHHRGQPESQNRADQRTSRRLRKRASAKRSKPWTIA